MNPVAYRRHAENAYASAPSTFGGAPTYQSLRRCGVLSIVAAPSLLRRGLWRYTSDVRIASVRHIEMESQ